MSTQHAFLGMGLMGQAMSKNLAAKGNLSKSLILWNRTHRSAEETAARIGRSSAVESLSEVIAKSDIIWSCLYDQKATEEVYEEILELDLKAKLIIECSTVSPEGTSVLARKVLRAGAEFVAMPVFGEPSMAEAGKLYCVPAGPPNTVARIKPYLVGVIGQAVVDLSGEEPSKASLLKLIGNLLIMTTIQQISEAHVLAEKTGLGTRHMSNLIAALFPRPPHTIYSAKMISGDYYKNEVASNESFLSEILLTSSLIKPMVDIAKAQAVASYVMELAKASNTSLESYEVAIKYLNVAAKHAGPRSDITGIYGAVRLASELPFGNEPEALENGIGTSRKRRTSSPARQTAKKAKC